MGEVEELEEVVGSAAELFCGSPPRADRNQSRAGDCDWSVGESLLVAALAHAGGEGAVVERRHREEQGGAPAERLLELHPSTRRGHLARVGIRHQLRPGDVRPFPGGRTARREHEEE